MPKVDLEVSTRRSTLGLAGGTGWMRSTGSVPSYREEDWKPAAAAEALLGADKGGLAVVEAEMHSA